MTGWVLLIVFISYQNTYLVFKSFIAYFDCYILLWQSAVYKDTVNNICLNRYPTGIHISVMHNKMNDWRIILYISYQLYPQKVYPQCGYI